MTTTPRYQRPAIPAARGRRRHLSRAQTVFAAAAAIGAFALFEAATPVGPPSVRLADVAIDLRAPASGPFGGLAADSDDDEAQLQEQLALQEMQQAQQQAELQNEQAQQQAQQAEQQGQWVEDHPGP